MEALRNDTADLRVLVLTVAELRHGDTQSLHLTH